MPLAPDTRHWTIYKITSPSGRVYVGKTSQFKVRMSQYQGGSGGGVNQQRILYQSILKHGFSSHRVDVLEEFISTGAFADGKEMFWIRSFMSNLNKWRDGNGMNLTDGGEGAIGHKWSEDRKRSFSEKRMGSKMPDEQKKKLSKYFTENPSRSMLGVKMSAESRQKMSDRKKGMVSVFKGKSHTWENRMAQSSQRLGVSRPSRVGKKMVRAKSICTKNIPVTVYDLDGNIIEIMGSKRRVMSKYVVGKNILEALLTGANNSRHGQFVFKLK